MSKKREFLEKIYYHELDRKQALENMFALPTGIIAALFGLVSYYLTKFNFTNSSAIGSFVAILFFVTGCIALLLLILATFWCARAVIGSEYEHLPGANTMIDYWHELDQWHVSNLSQKPKIAAEADFEIFLENALSRCCQKNWKTNLYRSEELYRSKRAIVGVLILVAVLSLCYYINFWLSTFSIH